MRFTLRSIFTAFGVLCIVGFIWQWISPLRYLHTGALHSSPLLATRRREVVDAFEHAWSGYSQYCMGHDTMHPVTNTCDNDFAGWGATAIDSLTTAIIFGKEDVVLQILTFISTVNFEVVQGGSSIQLFEVTIRHFGAMLSAYDLLNGPFSTMARNPELREALFNQIIKLGNILTCGFNTPSGIPRNWVNPVECTTDSGTSNTVAGVGSMILEFMKFSEITGNKVYAEKAKKAESYLINPHPEDKMPYPGLYGSFVSIANGELIDNKGGWGALADSFYEYLLKAYIYDSNTFDEYLDRWKLAADSTIRHIGSHPYGHPEWTLLPYWEGQVQVKAMDSLSWFAGGNFILGGMVTDNKSFVDFGLSIADAGGAVYAMTATGLGGEYVHWTEDCSATWDENLCTADNSIRIGDATFNLRPEVLETWYHAYRATGDTKYREWAWSAFQAINRVCKTETGFSAISNVTALDGGKKLDKQESFVFAEVMKYIYLIHLDDDRIPYHVQDSRKGAHNLWVFNTEAHPLKVSGPPI